MTAKTVKVPNYTPEQFEKAKADYEAGVSVEKIAEALGKTTRSVIAKLSKEQVYKAKTYTTKAGEKPVKKDAHADAIGAIFDLSEGEIESLTKANKTALVKIVSRVREMQNALELSQAESA
jgi:hypothetical protein